MQGNLPAFFDIITVFASPPAIAIEPWLSIQFRFSDIWKREEMGGRRSIFILNRRRGEKQSERLGIILVNCVVDALRSVTYVMLCSQVETMSEYSTRGWNSSRFDLKEERKES